MGMKLFSKAGEYAIRAMIRVIKTDSLDGFSPKEVCQATGIPEPFACKVLGEMAKARILKGFRGPGGGYQLRRAPSEVSLLDIILAVDGENAFSECPLGLVCQSMLSGGGYEVCETCTLSQPDCGLSDMCPLHGMWKDTRKLVLHHLETTTLKDIQGRLSAVCSDQGKRSSGKDSVERLV